MKCPQCEQDGTPSRVVMNGYGAVTAMWCPPFYDEDGVYHSHDINSHSTGWLCSNGHSGSVLRGNRCPAPECSFGDDGTIRVEATAVGA